MLNSVSEVCDLSLGEQKGNHMEKSLHSRPTRFILLVAMATMLALCATLLMAAGTAQAASISKKSLSMTVKQSYTLSVKDTKKTPTWTSSKKSVVTVSKKGVVTAKKAGTATVTGKIGSKKYTCAVTVLSKSAAQKKANKLYKSVLSKTYVTINGKKYKSSKVYFALSDFNKDGVKDLLVTNGLFTTSTSKNVRVYIYAFGGIKGYDMTSDSIVHKGVYGTVTQKTLVDSAERFKMRAYATFYKWDINGKRYRYSQLAATFDTSAPSEKECPGGLYETYAEDAELEEGGFTYYMYYTINGKVVTADAFYSYEDRFAGFSCKLYKNTSTARTQILK